MDQHIRPVPETGQPGGAEPVPSIALPAFEGSVPRSVVAALAGLALLFAAELSGLIPDTARKPLAAGLTLGVVVVTVLYVDRRRRSRPGQR